MKVARKWSFAEWVGGFLGQASLAFGDGAAPAEPDLAGKSRLGGSLALPSKAKRIRMLRLGGSLALPSEAKRIRTLRLGGSLALPFLVMSGCITGKQNPAATQPATAADPKSNQWEYWFDKPGVTEVSSGDFDKLWNACRASLVGDGFTIDRQDYRDGVMTTLPLVSKQFYEFWRGDVVTGHDLAQSSLGTVRRTVRIKIRRDEAGKFYATPKVVVDRFSLLAKRITSVSQYRSVFALTTNDLRLSTEEDGPSVVAQYWYPIARDYNLEKDIVKEAKGKL